MKNINAGVKNGMWKGDEVGYSALHEWVRRKLLKPASCVRCNSKKAVDLANKGTYSRELKNWEWLCRRCHMIRDGRMRKLNSKEIREKIVAGVKRFYSTRIKKTAEEKREYMRQWKLRNPEAYKNWFQKNKKYRNSYMQKWRADRTRVSVNSALTTSGRAKSTAA